ncbi:MAG: DNA-3-methyladenine glycosylase I [Trueperaceae bacterium]|nr:DNA-3-methyladenine glycosylase I [Trueperaceae bacterium]MCC6310481.1 DNA-3-methyladenine glycosylase I [Trueperaceae bacterium]MCO5173402.1 DNA-3-methyladenine glycosylase I [Trueperaceae bacterium]MCW5819237.1 DNA-3-methyladenine glycosylase I [Trueperaceae bacterium]
MTTEPDGSATRPAWAEQDDIMRAYYDHEWGVPVTDERGLFEALSLEVFQTGLSWSTVLRKRPAFREAFADFRPEVVARFEQSDVARLMTDAGIVRNEQKIRATVRNAAATVALRDHGGLVDLVWSFRAEPGADAAAVSPTRSPESEALAKALRARDFTFVGPTTMYALMQAIGVVDVRGERTTG